ncbi:MAG: hypothetical protein HY690_10780 [Chloroflexi bacterium]|nr:hypothetical protein [Chloroflexota bacterium]
MAGFGGFLAQLQPRRIRLEAEPGPPGAPALGADGDHDLWAVGQLGRHAVAQAVEVAVLVGHGLANPGATALHQEHHGLARPIAMPLEGDDRAAGELAGVAQQHRIL